MFDGKESGYMALGAILFGALAGLVMLSNQNSKTAKTIKTAEVRKVSLESEELALYGFSVVKQLLSNASGPASLRLQNQYDPLSLNDIKVEAVNLPSNGAITLMSSREITVAGPDLLTSSSSTLNGLFEGGSFANLNTTMVPIRMKVIDFETYPSGYGVRTLLFDSRIDLLIKGEKTSYSHKARIPVPPTPVDCKIMVQGQVVTGNSLSITKATADESVAVNASCTGELIQAQLLVDLVKAKEAILPKSLNPLFMDHMIKDAGQYSLSLQATRVDDQVFTFGPITLNLASPLSASMDFKKCLHRCTCAFPDFEPPTLCAGSTDFVVPFVSHMSLDDPLPAITGNPLTDSNALRTLDNWAYAHGALNEGETHGARLQGMLYPSGGYGKKLVCTKVGGGGDWAAWSFDPDNNCQEEFVGYRGALGCLLEGTQVLVGPDQLKAIEDLTQNDRIWNPLLSRYYEIQKMIHGPEKKDLYEIEVQGRSITMTYDHPILTQRGYIQAHQLKAGDQMWIDTGFAPVGQVTRKKLQEEVQVWNLVLKEAKSWEEHLIFAEGIAVGDLWMQTELAKNQKYEK
jgi:hypothetical protein